jgi:hypothetical protein
LRNGSAIAWDANPAGRRWGIAQGTAGLNFFRTFSSFGSTSSPAEYAMVMTNEGNITQPLQNNGLVKAMALIAGDLNSTVVQCYNSQATGAVATTPPCGIDATFEEDGPGTGFLVDFGFVLIDRFISVTPKYVEGSLNDRGSRVTVELGSSLLNPNRARVILRGDDGPTFYYQGGFFIFVY